MVGNLKIPKKIKSYFALTQHTLAENYNRIHYLTGRVPKNRNLNEILSIAEMHVEKQRVGSLIQHKKALQQI
ncbi:MAG: hypothetical protein MHPSP_003675, partial [Paramarteilia canceri]